MAEPTNPEIRIKIDAGNGYQNVTAYHSESSATNSIMSGSDTASVILTDSIYSIIPDLGTKDKIKIEAKYETDTDYTVLFEGYMTVVKRDIITGQVNIEAEDFTRFFLDAYGTNAYENINIIDMLKNVLDQYFPQFYYDSITIPDDTLIIPNYAFEEKNLFEVMEYVAEMTGRDFWVEPSTDTTPTTFYMRQKTYDETIKETLEVGVNLTALAAVEDKTQMWNHVIVTGDKRQFDTYSDFVGTGNADYVLTFKPHVTQVLVDGVLQKGGIIGSTSDPDYTVDFYNKKITFIGASIPPVGADVRIGYTYDVPIKVEAEDSVSISTYGRKTQPIKNTNINSKSQAVDYAKEYLEVHKLPMEMVDASCPAKLTFKKGDFIKVKDPAKSYEADVQVIETTYNFSQSNGFTQEIKGANTAATLTGGLKEIIRRIKQLEELLKGDIEIVTKLQTEFTSFIIRVKRTYMEECNIPSGFLWSKVGSRWTGDNNHATTGATADTEWGIATPADCHTAFDIGERNPHYTEEPFNVADAIAYGVVCDTYMVDTLVWSGACGTADWSKRAWSGNTATPAPTPSTSELEKEDLFNTNDAASFNLEVEAGLTATLWSIHATSPPLWGKMKWQDNSGEPAPTPIISEIEQEDGSVYADALSFELTNNLDAAVKVWTRFSWGKEGTEPVIPIAPTELPIQNNFVAHDTLSFELTDSRDAVSWVWGARQWNKDGWTRFEPDYSPEYVTSEQLQMDLLRTTEIFKYEVIRNIIEGFIPNIELWGKSKW